MISEYYLRPGYIEAYMPVSFEGLFGEVCYDHKRVIYRVGRHE